MQCPAERTHLSRFPPRDPVFSRKCPTNRYSVLDFPFKTSGLRNAKSETPILVEYRPIRQGCFSSWGAGGGGYAKGCEHMFAVARRGPLRTPNLFQGAVSVQVRVKDWPRFNSQNHQGAQYKKTPPLFCYVHTMGSVRQLDIVCYMPRR